MQEFEKVKQLPPYVFEVVSNLKLQATQRGEDIVDFGMGNPDQPPSPHIINALITHANNPDSHRYSLSKGIPRVRQAITQWYQRRYGVELNPETETIAVMGSKEGIAHLAMVTTGQGDSVIVPSPCYPIHLYGSVIAGAMVKQIPVMTTSEKFLENLVATIKATMPRPKMLILSFPCNPTTQCVDLAFFSKVIAIAKEFGIWVVHDLAYGDIVFEGGQAPSILQVPGAKDVAVEFFTMSKSYNMPGWRVGFMSGNSELVSALTRIKSYLDYGMFTPIQEAAAIALEGPQDNVFATCDLYRQRRDILCNGLNRLGWKVALPKATMFVWAKIPELYRQAGSVEFAKRLITEARVAVSPGIGFGEFGDDYVRFSLIESDARIQQALAGIAIMFARDQKSASYQDESTASALIAA